MSEALRCLQLAVSEARPVSRRLPLAEDRQTTGIACFALTKNSAPPQQALRDALPPLRGAAKAAVIQALGHRIDVSSAPLSSA